MTYADDTHVGFWLGVDSDNKAKFNLGGATHSLKWTGTQLEITGLLTWSGGKGVANDTGLTYTESANSWLKVDSTAAYLLRVYSKIADFASGGGLFETDEGNAVYGYASTSGKGVMGVSESGSGVYGNSASGAGVFGIGTLTGVKGQSLTGVAVHAYAQNSAGTSLKVEGAKVDGGSQRYTNLADATAATDAVNRQTGDGRYLVQLGGYTGSFVVGAQTVTVVNGQITSVV